MKKLLLSMALLASCANVMGNDTKQNTLGLSMFGNLLPANTHIPTLNLMGPPPKSQQEIAEDKEYSELMSVNIRGPLTEKEKIRREYLKEQIDKRPIHF